MATIASPADIDFASLLCSRLCHDLLSPVGALNNGIELLADETDPAMREQCMGLLADSARTTAGKLKFFRLAFGAAGGFGEEVPLHEIRTALEGIFPPGGKLTLEWLTNMESLPKPAAKILLNLAFLTGEALPRGGSILLGSERRGNGCEIVVRGEGPKLIFDPSVRAVISGGSDLTAKSAGAYLVRHIVEASGGAMQISGAEEPFLLFGAQIAG